jgi:hypothetical protein
MRLPESDVEAAHVVVPGLLITSGMSRVTILLAKSIAELLNTPALVGCP